MQNEILGILRENEGAVYVSGEHISRMLGISRATVWKHVQKLQREGFVIDAVTRKGYRLMSAGDVLASRTDRTNAHHPHAGPEPCMPCENVLHQ